MNGHAQGNEAAARAETREPGTDAPPVGELSPMKRALLEIRRLRAELDEARRAPASEGEPGDRAGEPVAIVGLAVRLPGGVSSPERFWEALETGEDMITPVPPERWEAARFRGRDAGDGGTMYDVHGGFLRDVDLFDPEFFGITPREAESMDPQQRLLLELSWEALERAGIDPRRLRGTRTGIYVGMGNSDYGRLLLERMDGIDGYTGVGSSPSIAAGRVAYFLGTHGPAMVIDTACSSSLVALHGAVRALRSGEVDAAIVAGSNLILSPEMNVAFAQTGMLAPDGRCKTFAAGADGYVRSEACCVVVLKRSADAARDGDLTLAEIVGSAVNQDGRSAGLTAPNGPAQEDVMRAALEDAGLQATAVRYVEAHGTGTPLGDPMEMRAIGGVYGPGRSPDAPLRVGSVKTNLGHTEAAAGLVGLIKVVLMMGAGRETPSQPRLLPPHLHLRERSAAIDWERWPIEVATVPVPWRREGETVHAAVSSFGFSGTNAHVVLRSNGVDRLSPDAEAEAAQHRTEAGAEGGHSEADAAESTLCLSAADLGSLRALAAAYVPFLKGTSASLGAICRTALTGRARLRARLAVRARSVGKAAAELEAWLDGRASERVLVREPEKQGRAGESAATSRPRDRTGEAPGDPLRRLALEFLESGGDSGAGEGGAGSVPEEAGSSTRVDRRDNRRVLDLPVYPFARRRIWFGPGAEKRTRLGRDTIWSEVRAEAERQSRQAPLGWSATAFPERKRVLAALTRAHARNTLAAARAFPDGIAASVEEVIGRCGFLPIYANLLRRWMRDLAVGGVLIAGDENSFRAPKPIEPVDLAPFWAETERALGEDRGLLRYLRNCGALLRDVLTGQTSALETLFPGGSFALAEALYEGGLEARYSNAVVARAVRAAAEAADRRAPLRVLEIGGGTGGTTASILPLLPAAAEVRYWFTDVSELFLRRAERKFAAFRAVRYGLLDIDREIGEQGFGPASFDVVIAANVVHAARSLEGALGRIRRLLAPGGVLVLLETTDHQPWFDMSIGLIEGWQHFADAGRAEHPLLGPERWTEVLERAGFRGSVALPEMGSEAGELGQHILLAQSDWLQPDGAQPMTEAELQAGEPRHSLAGEAAQRPRVDSGPATMPTPGTSLSGENVESDLGQMSAADRAERIATVTRGTICDVFHLGTDPEQMGDRDHLTDLGMDSLLALELRAELEKRLGLNGRIPSTIAFDTGTLGELIRRLESLAAPSSTPSSTDIGPGAAAGAADVRAPQQTVTAEQLDEMSEAEVEELLKTRLVKR